MIGLFDKYHLDKEKKGAYIARSVADRYYMLKLIHENSWNLQERKEALQIFIESFNFLTFTMVLQTRRLKAIIAYILIKFSVLRDEIKWKK